MATHLFLLNLKGEIQPGGDSKPPPGPKSTLTPHDFDFGFGKDNAKVIEGFGGTRMVATDVILQQGEIEGDKVTVHQLFSNQL